jgi:hypothetical protein
VKIGRLGAPPESGSIWDHRADETADDRARTSGMMTSMPIETDELFDGDPAACAPVADETTGEVRLLSERCSTCIFRPVTRSGPRCRHGSGT